MVRRGDDFMVAQMRAKLSVQLLIPLCEHRPSLNVLISVSEFILISEVFVDHFSLSIHCRHNAWGMIRQKKLVDVSFTRTHILSSAVDRDGKRGKPAIDTIFRPYTVKLIMHNY